MPTAHVSKSFGTQVGEIPHLVKGEVADLRRDIDRAFKNAEAREGFPELDGIGSIPLGGGNVGLVGRNLLQSTTFDSVAITDGADVVTFTACLPGDSGLKVVFVAGVGALSLAYAAGILTVTLAAGGSTDDAIAAAVNDVASPAYRVIRADSAGTAGGMTTAVAATKLTGGVGLWTGFAATIAGVNCPIRATAGGATTSVAYWSDTLAVVVVPDLSSAYSAGDPIAAALKANGVHTNTLSTPLLGGSTTGDEPEVIWIDDIIEAVGSDAVLKGTDLLQGATFDTLAITEGGDTITFHTMKPGDSGITVEIVAGVGALGVTFAAGALVVTLAAGGSTDDAIATEVNKVGSQCKGYVRCVSSGGGGGMTLAVAAAPMTGGTGDYAATSIWVSGRAQLPTHAIGTAPGAAWSDTQVAVTVEDLTAQGRDVNDPISVVVEVNGSNSLPVTAVLYGDMPEITWGNGSIPEFGGDVVLNGLNLLQGMAFDTLAVTDGADVVTFSPLKPGDSGITVEFVAGVGALAVTFNPTTGTLVVTLAAGGSTDDAIATEVNKVGSQCKGYVRAVSAGTAGGMTAAQGPTAMAGGVGSYADTSLSVSGRTQLPAHAIGTNPAATWSDTQISMTVEDLHAQGRVVGDSVVISVMVDDLPADLVAATLTASDPPEINWVDSTMALIGGDEVIKGTNLLREMAFDTIAFTEGGDTITFTCLKPGDSGITVEIVVGVGALAVTYAHPVLEVVLAAGGSTDDAIATEVNKVGSACKGYVRCVSGGGGGGMTGAMAATPMGGGIGDYANTNVWVAGLAQVMTHAAGAAPAAAWSATELDVAVEDLTAIGDPLAAADTAIIRVEANGNSSYPIAVVLA